MAEAALRARYRRILRFAGRALVQTWWYELFLPRFGLARLGDRNRSARMQGIASRFHALALELGGLMIKVGQFMSSRLDVLPPEITRELAGLQDAVPPVDFDAIRALAEVELAVPLHRAFEFFDPVPLAAASFGQAHRARLAPGDSEATGLREVVVKVQRPGIDRVIDVDMRALRKVAGWLSRVRVVARRVDTHALVEEFSRTSLEEIDYLHEASNADRFAEDFRANERVRVPAVVWERTTRRVLTLEDVTAIKINDVDALRAAGISPREVADAFAAVMFDQLFEHGFFHADPHPGNIFVTPRAEGEADASAPPWRLTFIDFGMMGEAPDALRHGLRRLMIAAAARDGKGMVASISELGVLLPSANGAELERALSALFARFGGMGFAELARVDQREFVAFGREFGDVVREMPFQLPENFLLIIRAMSLTSGMCSALDPAFNIWDAIEPYASRLIREERGNLVQDLARRAATEIGSIASLPRRVHELVDFIEDGHIEVKTPRLDQRLDRLERAARRVAGSVIFAAFFVGGVLLRAESEAWGAALMIVSGVPLLYSVLAGILSRTGRGRHRDE